MASCKINNFQKKIWSYLNQSGRCFCFKNDFQILLGQRWRSSLALKRADCSSTFLFGLELRYFQGKAVEKRMYIRHFKIIALEQKVRHIVDPLTRPAAIALALRFDGEMFQKKM
jgi:hypothetical protein